MVTKTQPKINPQWYDCDACGGRFQSSAPPDGQQKLYELHGCVWGKRKALQENITCKHCGAVTGGTRCGCPEAVAQLKADDDASDKRIQEDNDRYRLREAQRAVRQGKEKEGQEEYFKETIAALRKVRERKERDVALHDRRQGVEARELTRSERRQDFYDAAADDSGQAKDSGEPDWDTFDSMTMDVVRSTIGKLPAILSRTDGRTIFYAQKVNTAAARPNGGKSWLAIKVAMEVVSRRGRVLMLDFDNKRPSVLAGRAGDMGVEATIQNKEHFQFKDVEMVKHKGAMAAAIQWLLAAEDPTFSTVIIDSDTAALVPNDGGDVLPWWATHVTPWEAVELGVLILSHRPKLQDEDTPPGSIGSQTKRALPTGAVLIMKTTKMWNSEVGGLVHLVVDKDRNGELPGVEGEIIVDMVVEHVDLDGDKFLNITLEPPDEDRGNENTVEDLETALANHPEGVYSQRAVRGLVKGSGKAVGLALKTLIEDGHVIAEKVEGKRGYVYKSSMFKD